MDEAPRIPQVPLPEPASTGGDEVAADEVDAWDLLAARADAGDSEAIDVFKQAAAAIVPLLKPGTVTILTDEDALRCPRCGSSMAWDVALYRCTKCESNDAA